MSNFLTGGVQQLTDLQFFGAINPQLVEAASAYGTMKSTYDMDRPWLSPEESAAAEEEENRGKQATNLLGRAASGELQEGVYTWNGSSWARSSGN